MDAVQAEPVFDAHDLKERLMDDEELVREILGHFERATPQLLSDLRSAAERGALGEARRHAHSVKGSAANVGAPRLRALGDQVEHAAERGELASVKGAVPAIEAAYAELLVEIRRAFP